MKIAFLLVVHKNVDQVNMFIEQLLKFDGSYIFIHIDKKAINEMNGIIKKNNRVTISENSVDVEWGDFTQIYSTLELLKLAKNHNVDFDYYSLHSGQDLAIKPIKSFADFLERNKGKSLLQSRQGEGFAKLPLPGMPKGGFERFQINWPRKKRNIRLLSAEGLEWIICRGIIYPLYVKGLIKGKKLPDIHFYKGSNWFTLYRDAVEYIFNYINNNKDYVELFRKSYCCDEIFFHTILLNSDLKNNIINDDYRYTDWSCKNESNPKTFIESDFEIIINSNKFFGRKFDIDRDSKVLEQIIKHVDNKVLVS